jgi:hypothetical protein
MTELTSIPIGSVPLLEKLLSWLSPEIFRDMFLFLDFLGAMRKSAIFSKLAVAILVVSTYLGFVLYLEILFAA